MVKVRRVGGNRAALAIAKWVRVYELEFDFVFAKF
jgi:hypothetical protein